MDSKAIRKAFLDYFAERGHERVASGPIVPANDPTLMFANAGMVQFKDVFTGKDVRPYSRAATSQKCIRISGKHNDLENVGVTARHHTFFEMLGNFSFGDYFKREAIEYAWKFLTEVMEIDQSRMVVSIFGGDDELPADEEAAKIWAEVSGFGPERIMRCGAKDNFWSMGDTGPCGPCSEIFYFIGEGEADVSKFDEEPGIDGKGWTEIWNNVFMQFERHADGKLTPLPAPSVDTGMGLERLSVLKQGVTSNYDTDLLRPLVDLAAKIAGKKYGGSLSKDDISMRVIADHARTTAFMIAEGIFPDKADRSYVLRRVMRRAIRHGHRLGIEEPFLHEVALLVVQRMGDVYPELEEQSAVIVDVTKQEEERFRETLARGLAILEDNDEWMEAKGEKRLPGAVAFKLYDTYGFPLDLQRVIGEENGFGIDEEGYEAELAAAKERSKGSKVGEEAVSEIFYALHHDLGDTDFVGYEDEEATAQIVALVKDGERVDSLTKGDEGQILVDVTPFYAESGGQVGDEGRDRVLRRALRGRPTPRSRWARSSFTTARSRRGPSRSVRRSPSRSITTAACRRAATTRRRTFSTTRFARCSARRRRRRARWSARIGCASTTRRRNRSRPRRSPRSRTWSTRRSSTNVDITTDVLPMDEAKARGAIGIFEEKYGEVVRMLTMSEDSIELCGGTHASRTGDIGYFKLLSESGLAAGVRRIEAATGWNAIDAVRAIEREVGETAALLKTSPAQLKDKAQKLVGREKELEREIDALKHKMMSGGGRDYKADARAGRRRERAGRDGRAR